MNSSSNVTSIDEYSDGDDKILLDQDEVRNTKGKPDSNQNAGVIALEGKGSPDLPLAKGEFVLLDVSQGWRDLGLFAKLARHKGRLIVTNRRALVFVKKTRDYDVEQMRISHAGYIKMGHRLGMKQLITALTLLFSGIAIAPQSMAVGVGISVFALLMLFMSRTQSISILGSGGKLHFDTRSVSHMELAKVLTVLNGAS